MSEDNINNKIKQIYNKIQSSINIVKGWIIIDEALNNKIKNKLIIINIGNINSEINSNTLTMNILCETKNKYYYIKYSPQFIGIIESDTEYGLVLNTYDIYAVNSQALENSPPFNKNLLNIKDIFDIVGFKLSKNAKEYIKNI